MKNMQGKKKKKKERKKERRKERNLEDIISINKHK